LTRGSPAASPKDPPALPPAAALATAQQLIDDGHAFAAHEVLEAVWKADPGPERDLWRGLAQLAVGITHRDRGNLRGATSLLARGAETLSRYDGRQPHGVPVAQLRAWAASAAADPAAAAPMPRLAGGGQAADERA
jgi:hypothetical protein